MADVADGSTVLIGGFGMAGMPVELIDALIRQGASDLTVVNNNAGNGDTGLAALLAKGRVRKVICSFPRQHDSWVFDGLYREGRIELELVPQGNLAERMRAAGAGIGAFFCPTGVGTPLAEGKETREIDGRTYVLEYPIHGDVALIGAHRADRMGNLVYRKTARNFGPVMATAATATVVAQVREVVETGELDPEVVVTPEHLRRPGGDGMSAGEPLTKERDGRAGRAGTSRRGPSSTSASGCPPRSPTTSPPDSGVVLHTENGMLHMGPAAAVGEEDWDLTNAGKQPVTELPGASYFHHADSFAMMRGGHLDVCVLGAFQVSRDRRPRQLAHRCPGRDPRRRRGDGPGHRRQERVRDDDAVRQGRHAQAGAGVHLPAHRRRLRRPGLHRRRDLRHHARTAWWSARRTASPRPSWPSGWTCSPDL